MKNEEYKKLSIAEFTKAAGRYESKHIKVKEMKYSKLYDFWKIMESKR